MKFLTEEMLQAKASGKTILIGEHAVVYGYKALAMALPDIQLSMTLCKNNKIVLEHWQNVWHTIIQEKEVQVEDRINKLLLQAFEKALSLVGFQHPLSEFTPQKIVINSQIPLGGGMGGSAAISTCLVRIAAQIVKKELHFLEQIQFANEVDSLFHNGRASGLDVSAVASDGIIEFQKGFPIKKINHQSHFWLVLVDSGERSETALMIEKVKNSLEKNKTVFENLFHKLGELACAAGQFLEQGNVRKLADCLNEAHYCLVQIGISTTKMNAIVESLKSQGALAAKLTGAGGGGLVLGLFVKDPFFLLKEHEKEQIYITKI